jgi:hypothetical protein
MSAPNENALGDNKEAMYLDCCSSYRLVPKNMYRGRIEQKRQTGPMIAASLAFEKNEAIKKENVISDKQKVNRKRNTNRKSDFGRKDT